MGDLSDRLKKVQREANFTLTEFAFWIGWPYQTVRGWVVKDRDPQLAHLDREHLDSLLKLTGTMVSKRKGLPMPRDSRAKRRKYIGDLRKKVFP